jgi:3-isopropylmalate/(R)-2-methylmalate dehydratase small subunit
MEPFIKLTGVAAPLPLINVDTDMIIPKQYLKTIRRTGLGRHLFEEMRRDEQGREVADFVLNREPCRNAVILIAGANFGCGSSREHAPWALLDFGIRCVIAPSFADIFRTNCLKNGILPVALDESAVERLMAEAEVEVEAGQEPVFTADLEQQRIIAPSGATYRFDIEAREKRSLIEGLDDIARTLEKVDAIEAFEAKQRLRAPWLYR